jgi:hypothetical protein
MPGRSENILTCNDKIDPFKEKLTPWEARKKKVEMFELTKNCRLGKNLVDLFYKICHC